MSSLIPACGRRPNGHWNLTRSFPTRILSWRGSIVTLPGTKRNASTTVLSRSTQTSPWPTSGTGLDLVARERFPEAFHEIRLALKLDPLSLHVREMLAYAYLFSGD